LCADDLIKFLLNSVETLGKTVFVPCSKGCKLVLVFLPTVTCSWLPELAQAPSICVKVGLLDGQGASDLCIKTVLLNLYPANVENMVSS